MKTHFLNASQCLRGGSGKNAVKGRMSRAKFASMIKEEKSVDRLRLDDDRVDWGEDGDYHNVETLQVSGVRVPEQWYNLVSDPAGFKGKRDIKHLKMVQRLQKKERIHDLRKKSASTQTERPMRVNHQLKLAEAIKNTLNDILANDVLEFPDLVSEEYQSDTIVNPLLQKGSPRFVNVSLTRDLKIAQCTWECAPNYEIQVRNQLTLIKKRLRAMLAARVAMRFVPKLSFAYNEKKIVTQDVERLLEKIEQPKPEDIEPLHASVLKRGDVEKLTQADVDEKMKHYIDILYNFHVTRQTILSPIEQKVQKQLQERAALKQATTSKRILYEKDKLNRTGQVKKRQEKESKE